MTANFAGEQRVLIFSLADRDRHSVFVDADPVHHPGGFARDDEALDYSRSFLSHVVQVEALKMLRMEEVVRANLVTQRASAAFPIVPARFGMTNPVGIQDVGSRAQVEVAGPAGADNRKIAGAVRGHMSAHELAGTIRNQIHRTGVGHGKRLADGRGEFCAGEAASNEAAKAGIAGTIFGERWRCDQHQSDQFEKYLLLHRDLRISLGRLYLISPIGSLAG